MTFFQINKNLFRELQKNVKNFSYSLDDTPMLTFQKYKTLLHIRHDLLHVLICELVGQTAYLGITRKITDYFPDVDFGPLSNKTPDIVFNFGGVDYIVDVTIAVNPVHEIEKKTEKYTPIIEVLARERHVCELVIIAFHSNLSNIETELFKVQKLGIKIPDPLVTEFIYAYKIVSSAVEKARQYVPDVMFESDDSPPFITQFKDPVEYGNIVSNSFLSCLEGRQKLTQQEAFKLFDTLYEDPEIQNSLRDKKHDSDRFLEAFNELTSMEPMEYHTAKPTFHFPYHPNVQIPIHSKYSFSKVDQRNCYSILKICSTIRSQDKSVEFLKCLTEQLEKVLDDPREFTLFETGFFKGSYEQDFLLKSNSEIYRKMVKDNPKKKPQGISIRRHILTDMQQEKPFAERSHQIALDFTDKRLEFRKQSGVHFRRHNVRKYQGPTSCQPSSSDEFEKIYHLLSQPSSKPKSKYDPLLKRPIGKDAVIAENLKLEFRENFKTFTKFIRKTHAYEMSRHTMIVAEQAMHYIGLNTRENSFYMVNTGLRNVMHIFQGGSQNRGKDIGRPFFSIVIAKTKEWFNSVWGAYKVFEVVIDGQLHFVMITNWRRLQTHKLSLLRDQFYSCQSTGFDTFARTSEGKHDKIERIKFCYSFRTLVAQCTSQRCAEFLMDVRYVIMSCYSDYTNVAALIKDKFSPHYPNAFSRWIVNQLRRKVFPISSAYKSENSFKGFNPIFKHNERLQNTVGGQIHFPSLWTDSEVHHLQDLFDELFVYVHTGKEPSSNFHEGIKSLTTISKFQSEYNMNTEDAKLGIHTVETFKELLLSKRLVGCWFDLIEYSARSYSKTLDVETVHSAIDKGTRQEVLSDIVSTKVCLPEYKLIPAQIIKEQGVSSAKKMKQIRQNLIDHFKENDIDIISEYEYQEEQFEDVHPDSIIDELSFTKRAKVHDVMLDFSIRYPEHSQFVLDVAHWNMFQNNNRVDAHICIKAQYGAKREFYVVNFGAKAMVRIYENIFKAISKGSRHEMISVPGDQKMFQMSLNANDVIKTATTLGDTFFVNGDCTKWSACETMPSFYALVEGMSTLIGPQRTMFSKAVLAGWADKYILVPKDVAEGVKFITEKTEYLKNGTKLHSTQNFLQGMFNYSSSIKAVCATEFAIEMWKYKYKTQRPILVRHLEHSDDYSLIIKVSDVKDFEDFRIMHKLSQRIHGINDSDKKTNCQRFIMEFISLMCFNGQMAYPNIKKTKEVGINIGGTGYQDDAMNIISRCSEAVRLGVPQQSAYVLQLIHGMSLWNKYSLGKRNSHKFSENPYNCPIDFFGLPDCLPILYLGTVGDPNNLRLSKYHKDSKRMLHGLYMLTKEMPVHDYISVNSICATFYKPLYIYQKSGNKIKKIRSKIGWSVEEIENYRRENPEFTICKPREMTLVNKWLQAMYYNNSFIQAYNTASRQSILLRMSFFTSGYCIRDPMSDKILTLSDFIPVYQSLCSRLSENFDKENKLDFNRMVSNTDPATMAAYKLLDSATLLVTGSKPIAPSISKLPSAYVFLKLENNIASIIQYWLNNHNFEKDKRKHRGMDSLERDVKKIQQLLGKHVLENKDILQLQKLLKSQLQKHSVGLVYSPKGNNISELLITSLENGLDYYTQRQFYTMREFEVRDPITNNIIYSRDFLYTNSLELVFLENLTQLYFVLVQKYSFTQTQFRDFCLSTVEQTSGKNAIDFLSGIILDLSSPANTLHKRMFAFFANILLGDTQPLQDLVTSTYTARHLYLNQREINALGSSCTDGVAFHFRGKTFLALEKRGRVVVATSKCTITEGTIAYCIALKLFGIISQNQFETSVLERLHECMPLVDSDKVAGFLPIQNTYSSFSYSNNVLRMTKVEGRVFPILLNVPLDDYRFNDIIKLPSDPVCVFEKGMVFSGKLKLFNLPLWPCGPQTVLTYPDHNLVDNVNMKIFNTPNLLYMYLHDDYMAIKMSDEMITMLLSNFTKPFYERAYGLPEIITEKVQKVPTSSLSTLGMPTDVEKKKKKKKSRSKQSNHNPTDNPLAQDVILDESILRSIMVGGVTILEDEPLIPTIEYLRRNIDPSTDGYDQICELEENILSTKTDMEIDQWLEFVAEDGPEPAFIKQRKLGIQEITNSMPTVKKNVLLYLPDNEFTGILNQCRELAKLNWTQDDEKAMLSIVDELNHGNRKSLIKYMTRDKFLHEMLFEVEETIFDTYNDAEKFAVLCYLEKYNRGIKVDPPQNFAVARIMNYNRAYGLKDKTDEQIDEIAEQPGFLDFFLENDFTRIFLTLQELDNERDTLMLDDDLRLALGEDVMPGFMETQRDEIMPSWDEIDDDIDIEYTLEDETFSSTDSEYSEDSEEETFTLKGYIQLGSRNSEQGFVMTHIKDLPPLYIYLMRCWSGYSATLWACGQLDVFPVLRLAYEAKINGFEDLSPLEELVLKYNTWEVTRILDNGELNATEFEYANKYFKFDGGRIIGLEQKKFKTLYKADWYSKKFGGSFKKVGEFYVCTKNSNFLLSHQDLKHKIVVKGPKKLMWDILRDIAVSWDLSVL